MKTLPRLPHVIALAALASAAPALTQNSTPAQPLPGLDDFSLPSSRPTPRPSPTPEPTTNPQPSDTPTARSAPVAAPTPRSVTTPRAAPSPTPRATAAPLPRPIATASAPPQPAPVAAQAAPAVTPTASPTPETIPSPTPTPLASEAPVAPTPESEGSWIWLAILGALALLVIAGIALWMRQRARRDGPAADRDTHRDIVVSAVAEQSLAVPAAPIVAPEMSASSPLATPELAVVPMSADGRATLDLELVPKRAGTNLLSAAVEYLIVIRNTGAVPATGIRLDVRLLSAGQQQDALISALFAGPIDRPITTPFDLPPGSMVELGGMAMHPRPTLEVMEANGRTFFVPVLSVHVRYDWDGGSGQTGRSYVIGTDRGAGGKLAPFRLDAGARMVDTVRAIAYTVVADR